MGVIAVFKRNLFFSSLTYSRNIKGIKLRKTKFETISIYIWKFLVASAPAIVLVHLITTTWPPTPPYFTSCASSYLVSLTTSDVIRRHMYGNIMNTNESEVTWSVAWPDIMFAANPVLLLLWPSHERTQISLQTQRFWLENGSKFYAIRFSNQGVTEDEMFINAL